MTSESREESKMTLESGHTVEEVSEEEQAQINREFKAYKLGMIRLQPGGWFYLKSFVKYANKLYNFKCKPDDVFLTTFQKSGSTWMQEIVWTMRNNPNFDHPLSSDHIVIRSPSVDVDYILDNPCWSEDEPKDNSAFESIMLDRYPDINPNEGLLIQYIERMDTPRTIKTHLPFSLLPKNILDDSKAIYLVRNPKDLCVSYHHHSRLFKFDNFVGTFDQFVDRFAKDAIQWGPYWEHVKEGWARKDHPNLHWVFYEDLKANPKEEIKRLDKFLGTNLTEQQIDNVVRHTSFEAMKNRELLGVTNIVMKSDVKEQEGGFFRKGEVGDHKTKMTKAQHEKIDAWMEANTRGWDGPQFKWKSI